MATGNHDAASVGAATLLAASATFRTWFSLANSAAALAFIVRDVSEDGAFPSARVFLADTQMKAVSSDTALITGTARYILRVTDAMLSGSDDEAREASLSAKAGTVIDEMDAARDSTEGALMVGSFNMPQFERMSRAAGTSGWRVVIDVPFGPEV